MSEARPEKSTNVRVPAGAWALRLGFATATRLSPSLAARAAERLFLTPPRRRRGSRREREAFRGGEPFVVPFGRLRLRAWRFGEGPAVLLLHGWGGRAEQLVPFVGPLVAAGCSAVAFDAPAHGGSTGAIASMVHFADALSEVAARFEARAAVGHSIGAAGIAWALGGGLPLDAAVLVSPPRSPGEFFQHYCDAIGLDGAVRRATHARLARRFGAALDAFGLPERIARTSLPILVVHDRDDREVPWSDGAAIAGAQRRATLLTTEGLGHRRILRDPSVAEATAAFLWKHLARCACGRVAVRSERPAPVCARCELEQDLYDRSWRWRELARE